MPDPAVRATALSRRHGRGDAAVTAVRRASLDVHRGEAVGIAGPSGCGKSTLLRLLAGMDTPTGGTVRYFSGGNRPAPGEVMPIFQDPVGSLDPRWPLWRTVTEPLTARHRRPLPGRAQRRRIAADALAGIGLGTLDPGARPRTLSGGQCQRIGIARALVAAPDLLVADEPTSALDVSAAAGVLRLLRATVDGGAALVVVSHDRHVLGSLCDRVLEMSDGVLAG